MLYYLNNWQNRDHATIYGGEAFYDLWADGLEDRRVRQLVTGDTCLVLSRAGGANVAISSYKFSRARHASSDDGKNRSIWVLEGTLLRREVTPKTDAAQHAQYGRFFNRLGRVNRWSVLRDA
jgi:hypothetical protein